MTKDGIIVTVSGPIWNGLPIPQDAALDDLAEMVRQDPPLCWLAFRALAEHSDPRAVDVLTKESGNPDQFRRRAAVEALGQNTHGGAARGQVRASLGDSSPFVVIAALEASARLGDQNSHDAIRKLLSSKHGAIRREALQALGVLWRDDDLDDVLATMTNDPNNEVRKEAAWVLSRHAPVDPRLIERWRVSTLPRDRVWVCDFLARSSIPDRIAILQSLLHDPDGHVRKAARRA